MRLIDADKLLEMIEERIEESGKHRMAVLAEELIDVINDYAEDYEVEPVKRGQWIRAEAKGYPVKRSSIWYCSECGEKIKYNDTLGRYQKTKKTVSQVNPRCRKCGARMDGKERENDDKM